MNASPRETRAAALPSSTTISIQYRSAPVAGWRYCSFPTAVLTTPKMREAAGQAPGAAAGERG